MLKKNFRPENADWIELAMRIIAQWLGISRTAQMILLLLLDLRWEHNHDLL
ncbi:MAG: hypothetical protein HS129_01140 [Leptospiraceae bacterium]|nr:hypothetical protein [Leptospiraceae bacterium]